MMHVDMDWYEARHRCTPTHTDDNDNNSSLVVATRVASNFRTQFIVLRHSSHSFARMPFVLNHFSFPISQSPISAHLSIAACACI